MGLNRRISLFLKTLLVSFKYSYYLKTRNISFCLNQCLKPGVLKDLQEIQFVDRTTRRLLRYLQPQSSCLVHSFTLAQMTVKNAKIYLQISSEQNLQFAKLTSHAYVECCEQKFSTSILKSDTEDLLIWSKDNNHAFL